MLQISVADQNDSLTELELDGATYFLHLAWNSEAEVWTLGLENVNKETLIEGIPIVPDYPLLARYRIDGMPPGDLIAVAPDRRDSISRADLPAGIVALVYVSGDDLIAIAAQPYTPRRTSYFGNQVGATVITAPPVDPPPPAMDTAAGLLAYITSIIGTKVISGQFVETGYAQGMDPITDIHTATGKWLGIIGGDYYYYGSPGPADTNFNTPAIAYHAAGGIIGLNVTMPNPTTGGGADDTSALNAADMLVNGTATNTALKASLDQIAVGLAALRDANVPVLFRPYHELNGSGWFWWNSAFQSDAQFIAMWRYTHDYLTITKGLSNLLWVYCVGAGFDITARYPGNAYVDTVGFDYYGDNPGGDLAADYITLGSLGKPMWLTEFGSGDPSSGNTAFDERVLTTALGTNMPNLFAWLQWWDGNSGGNGWGFASVTQSAAALATSRVLNRDDLP